MDFQIIEPSEQDAYDPAPFLSYARAQRSDKAERDAGVGDVVHFWDGAECVAAIVIKDGLDSVRLRIFWPTDDARSDDVLHDETKSTDTWHWPCGGQ